MTRGASRKAPEVKEVQSADADILNMPLCVQNTKAFQDLAAAQERAAKATEDQTRALWAIVKQMQKMNERFLVIDAHMADIERRLSRGVAVRDGMKGSF